MRLKNIVLLLIFSVYLAETDSCPTAQYWQFVPKAIDRPFDIIKNPYGNPSQ